MIEVIEAKRWRNTETQETASLYGAVPYYGDRGAWIVESYGFTWRDTRSGTVGLGRMAAKTREEAQAVADGSLLPSNNKEVLQLRESALGDLQVRVLESADTHALFYRATGAESFRMIASHPNGFSCAELADRMIHAWTMPLTENRCACVLEQFDYILDCGGLCMKRYAFEELVRADRTALD